MPMPGGFDLGLVRHGSISTRKTYQVISQHVITFATFLMSGHHHRHQACLTIMIQLSSMYVADTNTTTTTELQSKKATRGFVGSSWYSCPDLAS